MHVVRKTLKESRGFTLVEIAIVVAIVGLLLLVALPLFSGARVRAYVAEARSQSSEWKALAWACLVERNFRESRCDSLTEHGWTAPSDSDVWDWNTSGGGGAYLACGATDTVATDPAPAACVALADTTATNAYVALVVAPFPGFIPSNFSYVLVLRTNTGKLQEAPADGSTVPTP